MIRVKANNNRGYELFELGGYLILVILVAKQEEVGCKEMEKFALH